MGEPPVRSIRVEQEARSWSENAGADWAPTEGVVSWQIDSNWQPCWRGRNVRIEIATDRGRGALQD